MLAEKCRVIIKIGRNDAKFEANSWNCLENKGNNSFDLEMDLAVSMGHEDCKNTS